ncbi:glycosyltransferase family 2 protein [Mucilaginibacter sp. CSA2-8R]|uniref:glycosyltransferase family 2 protein n=1 Tax=Mucilaginibacter sp. CSA2-8R TaxID=3141542 RepID=UPI00315CECD1
MANYPKISIITPSYNQGEFLEKTILSVIGQEYPNLEYIIVDGGSADNSVEIIKKYESKITYWVSEKDKGTYDANNKALEKVTGDYWCVVNSDDLLLPNSLHTLGRYINEQPKQKWFCGGVQYIDEHGIETGRELPKPNNPVAGFTFLRGTWVSHPTVFLHRDLITEVGSFHKWHLMDLNYWLRLEKAGYSPFIIPEYIAALRLHSNCKSNDRIKLQGEYMKIYNTFVSENNLSNHPDVKVSSKQLYIYNTKMENENYVVNRNEQPPANTLFKLLVKEPSVLTKKWYWGLVKRMLFGVHKNDPLLSLYDQKDNKSNWENK